MASVKKIEVNGKDGAKVERYRARYRDPHGKEFARHFRRKVDANRWLNEVTASIVTGSYVAPKLGRVTLRDYAEQWRANQPQHRPSTIERVESQFRCHVYPHLGHRPIGDITPSEIQSWVKQLGSALQPRTIAVLHGMLHGVFAAAVRDKRIAVNPCIGTRLPKPDDIEVVPFTLDQLDRLAAAVPARSRALVIFAATTGVRQGECFGLTLDRIDFLRRLVRIDRQLQASPGKDPEFRPPKTKASKRTIPLPQVTLDALAAHLNEWPVESSGLIFTDDDGNGWRRGKFGHTVWRPGVNGAGFPTGSKFHQLRHTYASLLIRHGESVKVVQARLGHASATETLDTYSHLWEDAEDTTRAAVDGAFAVHVEAKTGAVANRI